jgi:hypothetical protein
MSLFNIFRDVLQEAISVAPNKYLHFLSDAVRSVESASITYPILSQYIKKMQKIVSRSNFALNADHTNEFVQLLGEAHFFLLCAERGISLNRVPEGTNKTPDFHHPTNDIDIYFEIKTPSVVDGRIGINRALESFLDAQIELEKQVAAGKRVASAISVIQPYGDRPYKSNNGIISAVIETLIEKTRQNIKLEQFINPNTFLVVNLCLIPPFRTDNYVLRPAYCDDYMFSKALSGDLWMVAFAKPGMLVYGCPEFEGKPAIEGIIDKCGILTDPDFNNISGLLFMVHPWGKNPEIWGLFRSTDYFQWEDKIPTVHMAISKLAQDNWNDDKDSNGWQLQG